MRFGITKTGSMHHALIGNVLRCDNRKEAWRIIDLSAYPHMFCNLCERIVGKPEKPSVVWFYTI